MDGRTTPSEKSHAFFDTPPSLRAVQHTIRHAISWSPHRPLSLSPLGEIPSFVDGRKPNALHLGVLL